MRKINLRDLRDYIESNDNYEDLVAIVDRDNLGQNYLSLRCLSSVSDDYEEFASVYEDGTLDMVFGAVDLIDLMYITEEYCDEDTGEILPQYDNSETLFDLIVDSIRDDIEDGRDFLECIEGTLGLD